MKAPLPEGDLYNIPRYAEHREGIKKLINSALFFPKKLMLMPRGGKELFPKKTKFLEARRNRRPPSRDMLLAIRQNGQRQATAACDRVIA